jgi:hypothetical protein
LAALTLGLKSLSYPLTLRILTKGLRQHHVMSYLSQKHNTRLIFDPTYPKIDMGQFSQYNWTEFYGNVEEAIPVDMPEPLGKDLYVRIVCDSDHAGDKRTRCSHTGFLIFCNRALIDWVSKKQATIETSVFGAEFVAMKHGIEKLQGLCYKLRMMGIPLTGPSFIYADNKSQVTNSTLPESTLKKNVTPSATMRCENQLQWVNH